MVEGALTLAGQDAEDGEDIADMLASIWAEHSIWTDNRMALLLALWDLETAPTCYEQTCEVLGWRPLADVAG